MLLFSCDHELAHVFQGASVEPVSTAQLNRPDFFTSKTLTSSGQWSVFGAGVSGARSRGTSTSLLARSTEVAQYYFLPNMIICAARAPRDISW